jgi:hypothetical protein
VAGADLDERHLVKTLYFQLIDEVEPMQGRAS